MEKTIKIFITFYFITALCLILNAQKNISIQELVKILKINSKHTSNKLNKEQILAADQLYTLSKSKQSEIIQEIKTQKIGYICHEIADWFFTHYKFNEAIYFYKLALHNKGNLCKTSIPSYISAIRKRIRRRINLIQDNFDFNGEPLKIYVKALKTMNTQKTQKYKLLEQIKKNYPTSKIIDDVDFKIGVADLFILEGYNNLIQYWKNFLLVHPKSSLCPEVKSRLSWIYYNEGLENERDGKMQEAEKNYTLFIQQPVIHGDKVHNMYSMLGVFFERRGKLELAKQSYIKQAYSGNYVFINLKEFFEKYYSYDEFIKFLNEESKKDENGFFAEYLKNFKN